MNEQFSSHTEPTIWNVLPIFEQLIETLQMKVLDPWFSQIKDAILAGVKKASDYYNRMDLSPTYIMSQCKFISLFTLYHSAMLTNQISFESEQQGCSV